MIETIQTFDRDRPTERPTDRSSVCKWWRYSSKYPLVLIYSYFITTKAQKLMEKEQIKNMARDISFSAYAHSHQYSKSYTRKLINEKLLKPEEKLFLKRFEGEQNIGTIIM